ncbi:DNA-binding response regulator [Cohnella sp. CIP 111063]|jgi:DNA-binding NarL/FixJ family response regulator|uniref:response regulator transcription factor n=1 Tax=unclassified Cohnella TaxID=2636738 RepID=UPI000B9CAB16|nr:MULTISPECIES: response regulator transcription factor [unclassified Cohnella]OXS61577.1 DNA-binding response regulator [Cohnella sp. CIP 111063]PRX73986.1 LuxR family two component transcriptional regulator [Cohnella sp. SGD-V74]
MNGMETERLRLLLADDHPMFLEGLAANLQNEEGIEVAGQAADGNEAVRLAELLQPDVILMDVNMPGQNGIEATREIIRTSPHIGILILTMFDDDASVFSAMRSGARGYLLKGAQKEEILRAIHAVGGGEAIFSATIARKMMFYFDAIVNKAENVQFPQLTAREREVLQWIARDMSNVNIARRLGLSLKTVRNHVSNILSKLQAADRTQAVLMAREAGMGRDS